MLRRLFLLSALVLTGLASQAMAQPYYAFQFADSTGAPIIGTPTIQQGSSATFQLYFVQIAQSSNDLQNWKQVGFGDQYISGLGARVYSGAVNGVVTTVPSTGSVIAGWTGSTTFNGGLNTATAPIATANATNNPTGANNQIATTVTNPQGGTFPLGQYFPINRAQILPTSPGIYAPADGSLRLQVGTFTLYASSTLAGPQTIGVYDFNTGAQIGIRSNANGVTTQLDTTPGLIDYSASFAVNVVPVPEPASFLLAGAAGLSFFAARRRRAAVKA